ncbi:MAG TPA: PPC domain-containing DNA-binding protein [Crinalium sp.]
MDTIAIRLEPQQDLKLELDAIARQRNFEAACIVTCVGSLTQAVLRLAGQDSGTAYHDRFEIVSLVGTFSQYGSHYHMAIADSTGRTMGGHVMQGCLVYTTAEIVIGILPNISFYRNYDATTGYRELVIHQHS